MFGIGLRYPHHRYVLQNRPKVGFFEVHTENFIAEGGGALEFLEKISSLYNLSFHCVGLSLGSAHGLDKKHLKAIKNLSDRFKPFLLSDHISWGNSAESGVANDLLPVPYTKEALKAFIKNVKNAQDFFGRQILIENPSAYLEYAEIEMKETDFINEIVAKTGCGILLDINNIYVSCQNFDLDPKQYLKEIDAKNVKEIHLAGHSIYDFDGKKVRIDTHNDYVCDDVLELYKNFAKKHKNIPTLIEWDQDIPEFEELYKEMKKAENLLS